MDRAITNKQLNHTDRTLIDMLIPKLSLNECDKHVVLVLVMRHAVNTY
jgi:hypothetical protein